MSSKPLIATVVVPRSSGEIAREYVYEIECDRYATVSWLLSEVLRKYDFETFGDDPGVTGIKNETTGKHLDLGDDCVDCISNNDTLVTQGFTLKSTVRTRQTRDDGGIIRPPDESSGSNAAKDAAEDSSPAERKDDSVPRPLERAKSGLFDRISGIGEAIGSLARKSSGEAPTGYSAPDAGIGSGRFPDRLVDFDLYGQASNDAKAASKGQKPAAPPAEPVVALGAAFDPKADAPSGGRAWSKHGPRLPAKFLQTGSGRPVPRSPRPLPPPQPSGAVPLAPECSSFDANADMPSGGRAWGTRRGPRLPASFMRENRAANEPRQHGSGSDALVATDGAVPVSAEPGDVEPAGRGGGSIPSPLLLGGSPLELGRGSEPLKISPAAFGAAASSSSSRRRRSSRRASGSGGLPSPASPLLCGGQVPAPPTSPQPPSVAAPSETLSKLDQLRAKIAEAEFGEFVGHGGDKGGA